MSASDGADTFPRRIRRWLDAFSDDIAANRLDPVSVILAAIEEGETELLVCPTCSVRYVRPGSSGGKRGLCSACWMSRLASAHREALAEIDAKRELEAARQTLKRARDRSA